MKKNHRWNTEEYEKRTKELYRTELHKLYPSEAWSLYRTIPACETVLDLGCGNGAMAAIVHKISPNTQYTGMDHQENLMRQAGEAFPFARFHADNLLPFIETCSPFDAIMSWSVVKSFQNWRDVTTKMLAKAHKYVIFDLRIANVTTETWDENVCWADYGGRKGPILVLNYNTLKRHLVSHSEILERIEIVSYQSRFGKFVHFSGPEPEQFIVAIVLKKKPPHTYLEKECDIYEQLPENLSR